MSHHAKHHQSFFACSNVPHTLNTVCAPPPPPHYHLRFFIMKHTGKPTHTLLRKNPPDVALSPPPRATPCLARSSQAGSTTLGPPPILMPLILSMHPDSIHHICNPPRSPSCSLQRQQAKEKKRQKRREEYSRYHAEQCWPKYRLLSPALPLLAWSLLKTHPLLPGNNSPTAWGMELGLCCYLKRYSSDPAMAPWSPADHTC